MMEAEVEAILGRNHQPWDTGCPRKEGSLQKGRSLVGILMFDFDIPELEMVDFVF